MRQRLVVAEDAPRITVLAGVNGAGKSSVAGASLRQDGGDYFNPDEWTRRLQASGHMSLDEANARAWEKGRSGLEDAIRRRQDFNFETTLGGSTITELLQRALDEGLEVAVFYVGLASPELHIARVRARVAAGGHDIPEEKIRKRYRDSMQNLVRLAPRLTELVVYDNSAEADPKTGLTPEPQLILRAANGQLVEHCKLAECPEWAKPILGFFTVP